MSDWELRERLRVFGGQLIVRRNKWHVAKYYAGPDLRYNGTSFLLGSNEIKTYCSNLRKNWIKFQESLIKFEGEKGIELAGDGENKIYIRHLFGTGVSEFRNYGIISHEKTIDLLYNELDGVQERAAEIQRRMLDFQ